MTSIANTHNQATPASASQAPTAPSAVVAAPVSSALPAATGAAAVGAINAQADESSMMYFVTSGLTLLYKHSSRKHSRLRQECVDILAKLKSLEKARSEQPACAPRDGCAGMGREGRIAMGSHHYGMCACMCLTCVQSPSSLAQRCQRLLFALQASVRYGSGSLSGHRIGLHSETHGIWISRRQLLGQ